MFLNCFAVCLQLRLVLHVCAGVREADGEPVADLCAALSRAHGFQWPHQGLTRLPQLLCANHVQVNQGEFLSLFFPLPHTMENAVL